MEKLGLLLGLLLTATYIVLNIENIILKAREIKRTTRHRDRPLR